MRVLALDIGGTSIKSALFLPGGTYERFTETPSDGREGAQALMARVERLIDGCPGFDALAVSTSGQVDPATGSIAFANENIPGYTGMPLRERLARRYGRPVWVENDVNAAALGEGIFGAARGQRDFLCLTYGTGIGGAIVIDGRIYGGSRGVAGEVGHMMIHPDGLPCACGQRGCYEQYASTTALVCMARQIDPGIANGRALFAQLPGQPPLAAVVAQWITEVAHGLLNLIHVFNPSLIVLGGAVFEQPGLAGQLSRQLMPRVMPSYRDVRLRPAELGNMAGLYGALSLTRREAKQGKDEPNVE